MRAKSLSNASRSNPENPTAASIDLGNTKETTDSVSASGKSVDSSEPNPVRQKEDSSEASTGEKPNAPSATLSPDVLAFLLGIGSQPQPPPVLSVSPTVPASGEMSELAIEPDVTAGVPPSPQSSGNDNAPAGAGLQQASLTQSPADSAKDGKSVPNLAPYLGSSDQLASKDSAETSTQSQKDSLAAQIASNSQATQAPKSTEILQTPVPGTSERASATDTGADNKRPDLATMSAVPQVTHRAEGNPATSEDASSRLIESGSQLAFYRSTTVNASNRVGEDKASGSASESFASESETLIPSDTGSLRGMSGANKKSDMRKSSDSSSSAGTNPLLSTGQVSGSELSGVSAATPDIFSQRNPSNSSNHKGSDSQEGAPAANSDPFSNSSSSILQNALASGPSGAAQPSTEPNVLTSAPMISLETLRTDLLARAVEFKQQSSTSMTVVLRPDDRTELTVQLRGNEGRVEVQVHMERGDSTAFRNSWESLQHSLSQQGVRLAELSVASGTRPASNTTNVSPTEGRTMLGASGNPGLENLLAATASANLDGQMFSQRDQNSSQRQSDSESHRAAADLLTSDGFANSSSGEDSSGRFFDSSNPRPEVFGGRTSTGMTRSHAEMKDTASNSAHPQRLETTAWESWA